MSRVSSIVGARTYTQWIAGVEGSKFSMSRVPSIVGAKTYTQWIAGVDVSLLMMLLGANFGWIAPFVGKLSRPDPPFQATKEQISWVTSITSMSRIIGIITGSITANYFGSKTSLYACGFYNVSAWVSLICANSIDMILVNQFCCGLGMGTLYTIFPLYLGEILNTEIRGTVISFVFNGYNAGLLYGNLMGSYTDPWMFGVVNLVITIIYLVTFYFFPSTPHYLISCNKLEEAEKSMRYYNNTEDVRNEFIELHEFINSSPRVTLMESVRKLKDPVNLKTLLLINVVYSFVQLSGTYSVLDYLEVIFMASKMEIILPSTLVTIMSAIAVPINWVAVAIGDKVGRVTMLLFSCVVFSIAFIGWGLSFHLLDLGCCPTDLQWLVIVSALIFRINMSIGLTPVVPVLLSEFFAPNVKSVSSCLCNITSSLCIFISIKNFQAMVDHMTYQYVFYFYAALVLIVGIYTKLCVPETKGKSLQEIQKMLCKKFSVGAKKLQTQEFVSTICDETNTCTREINWTKL